MAVRSYIHVAPTLVASPGPPTAKARPSADRETEVPCKAPAPTSVNLLCIAKGSDVTARVYIHVAPTLVASPGPPTAKVKPSPDKATEDPCKAPAPTSSNFTPGEKISVVVARENTDTAPTLVASTGPPTARIKPSLDKETEVPCSGFVKGVGPSNLTPFGVKFMLQTATF